MRKTGVASLALAIALSTVPAAQAATARLRGTCTKVGQVQTVNKVKLVCTKVGKKLVWQKNGIPLPATLTWTNYKQFNIKITERVWQEFVLLSKSGTASSSKRTILVGPQSSLKDFDPASALDRAERLFAWMASPMKYTFVYFQCADQDWAKAEYSRTFQLAPDPRLTRECDRAGGIGWKPVTDTVLVNVYGAIEGRNRGFPAFLETHEYIHVLQWSVQQPGGTKPLEDVPTWLTEGQAQFFAVLGSGDDNAMFEYLLKRNRTNPEQMSASAVDDWLRCSCTGASDGRNYGWGAYVVFALSSIYGLQSTVTLLSAILNGATLEAAVASTFGESWDSLRPKLATYVTYLNGL